MKGDCTLCGLPFSANPAHELFGHQCYAGNGDVRCGNRIHLTDAGPNEEPCPACGRGYGFFCAEHLPRQRFRCDACETWHELRCRQRVPDQGAIYELCTRCTTHMARRYSVVARDEPPRHEVIDVPTPLADSVLSLLSRDPPVDEDLLASMLHRIARSQQARVPRSDETIDLAVFDALVAEAFANVARLESDIERRLYEALASAGLAAEFQVHGEVSLRLFGPDLAERERCTFPDLVHKRLPIAIYADGQAFHSSPADRERDQEINERLQAEGFRVLRFPGAQIFARPEKVVAQVRRTLEELTLPAGRRSQ